MYLPLQVSAVVALKRHGRPVRVQSFVFFLISKHRPHGEENKNTKQWSSQLGRNGSERRNPRGVATDGIQSRSGLLRLLLKQRGATAV